MRRLIVAILGTAIGFVGVGAARADLEYYTCVQHRVLGDGIYTTVGTCSRWVEPVRVVQEPLQLPGNAWVDANANMRSGASFESKVMFQTNIAERVTVHSWSEDGEWAWVGIFRGEDEIGTWTHKVNIQMDRY